jgi:hypothetical protein
VQVRLIAQEAKAKARLGESGLHTLLESSKEILEHLAYPDRPDNHFKVDPAKWDYYAMDVHRIAGDDAQATRYARTVISDNITPDGHELAPCESPNAASPSASSQAETATSNKPST